MTARQTARAQAELGRSQKRSRDAEIRSETYENAVATLRSELARLARISESMPMNDNFARGIEHAIVTLTRYV